MKTCDSVFRNLCAIQEELNAKLNAGADKTSRNGLSTSSSVLSKHQLSHQLEEA